jgi:hypothetical protein
LYNQVKKGLGALEQIALPMDYTTENLPQEVIDTLAGYMGNFSTKNARFRRAVCEHLGLEWRGVNGSGNCFFDSICLLLRAVGAAGADALTPIRLRQDVVHLFHACVSDPHPLCERIAVELEFEASQPLICSSRAKMQTGEKVHGLNPVTVPRYLEACAVDGVWVTGSHWLRAISVLHSVRVGVVIFGQEIIRFFGEGQQTILLYKVLSICGAVRFSAALIFLTDRCWHAF